MITNIVLHYSEAQRVFFYLDRKLSRYKDMMPKDNPFYDDLLLKIYGLNLVIFSPLFSAQVYNISVKTIH